MFHLPFASHWNPSSGTRFSGALRAAPMHTRRRSDDELVMEEAHGDDPLLPSAGDAALARPAKAVSRSFSIFSQSVASRASVTSAAATDA
jgi:hypothetical protein